MTSPAEIKYWNRQKNALEVERVYGERAVRWLYESAAGRTIGQSILTGTFMSRIYGKLQDTRWSARKVKAFIQAFSIPMEEFERAEFKSFNDFFIRKFKPGMRPITPKPEALAAFCEGRYFAFSAVAADGTLPIKGMRLSPAALLGDSELAKPFVDGPAFIARLCPVDYHRFHYPDDGRTTRSFRLPGPLHSVNPIALRAKKDALVTNARQVSLLETRSFGRLAYVEIGATMVGKIVQSHDETNPFSRGAEKGYFLFGGSCVVVLGEKGRWTPDADMVENTERRGLETLIRLGSPIARLRG